MPSPSGIRVLASRLQPQLQAKLLAVAIRLQTRAQASESKLFYTLVPEVELN